MKCAAASVARQVRETVQGVFPAMSTSKSMRSSRDKGLNALTVLLS
jgi:hypothetical protein